MHISWLGNTGIRIQTKPLDEDITLIIDPYKQATGAFPRSLSPHIVLGTRGNKDFITLSGEPFVLTSAGECEVKGVLVTAVTNENGQEVYFRIDSENLTLGHLGSASKTLTNEQLEVLSDVDILFVPIGGVGCYNPEEAVKAISAIEPRIVIPILYESDNDPKALALAAFNKEMGVVPEMVDKKYIVKKKDLPEEDMKVVAITKE